MPRAPSARVVNIVLRLEEYFEDCVTQTPLMLQYTAADVGDQIGESTATTSGWLQIYRDVNRGRYPGISARYVISCYERGRGAVWFIQSWAGITSEQAQAAHELTTLYSVMTVLREEIDPMLKNVESEFFSMVRHDRRIARSFAQSYITKLNGYHSMLLGVRRDLSTIRPIRLRGIVGGLSGKINTTLTRIEMMRDLVMAV